MKYHIWSFCNCIDNFHNFIDNIMGVIDQIDIYINELIHIRTDNYYLWLLYQSRTRINV